VGDATFYERVNIGDEIPSLEKQAILDGYRLPEIFGEIAFTGEEGEARREAERLGVDAIHTSKIFGGVYLLQFVSEMITNWLPYPKGWVQGSRLFAKFIGQVKFNETVICKGKITGKLSEKDKEFLVCDIWVENAHGNRVVIGEIHIRCE